MSLGRGCDFSDDLLVRRPCNEKKHAPPYTLPHKYRESARERRLRGRYRGLEGAEAKERDTHTRRLMHTRVHAAMCIYVLDALEISIER